MQSEGAALLAACWREAGLDAKRPRIEAVRGDSVAKVQCMVCKGDACTVKTLELPLQQGHLAPASADGKLLGALLGQPLSLGLVALHFALVACSTTTLPPMVAGLFDPVGGPMNALLLMMGIHACEGLFAMYLCVGRLGVPLSGALGWFVAVALTGFASLRWLLKLQKAASSSRKAS